MFLSSGMFQIQTDMVKNKCRDMLSTQMEVFAKTKDWDHGLVSNVYSVDMDTVTVHENQDPSTG